MHESLLQPAAEKSELRALWFVYVAFLFPAFAGFLFGYDIGGASGAVASLNAVSNSTSGAELSKLETSVFTSASLMGATAGSVLVFWIGQPLGRRRELMGGSMLYIAGALTSGLSPGNAASVVTGRVIYGFGIALSMHAAPVYISEMAPANMRGLLVSLKEGFIVLGILCGFAVSAVAETILPPTAVFRAVWLPAAIVGAIVVTGMTMLPPSPRWLLLRAAGSANHRDRHTAAAAAALRRLSWQSFRRRHAKRQ